MADRRAAREGFRTGGERCVYFGEIAHFLCDLRFGKDEKDTLPHARTDYGDDGALIRGGRGPGSSRLG